MRKTKIVCTMGPSTEKPGILRQLMENGMNVARFNFSHGDYEEHKARFDALRALSKELDLPVAAMLDTKGPEIRLGTFKNGVEKLADKKMFPGYVLIHMIMNDDTWYVVRNTRGVTGFVGPGSKPVPLSDEEMESLGFGKTEVALDYAVGDTIVVTAGAWKDTIGAVKSINESKHTLTINVEMFGRETPVELNFTEVKHM